MTSIILIRFPLMFDRFATTPTCTIANLMNPAMWFSRVGNVLSIGTTIDMVVDLSTDERVPMLERADEN